MTIRTATPPSVISQPSVQFDKTAFDALVWQKGYAVLIEEARQCPCHTRASGSALVTCQNCRGHGWLFLNPLNTRAIISNINKQPKYGVMWSEESVGTLSATFQHADRLAEMDRVTFVEVMSKRSETLTVRTVDGDKFVFLTYKPEAVLDVFYFASATTPLVKLTPVTDYAVNAPNNYILDLTATFPEGFNNTITVTYTCHPTYHVIDLPHDLRGSTVINNNGQLERINMPVQAILKKTHIVFDVSDSDGGIQTIDNSYK